MPYPQAKQKYIRLVGEKQLGSLVDLLEARRCLLCGSRVRVFYRLYRTGIFRNSR